MKRLNPFRVTVAHLLKQQFPFRLLLPHFSFAERKEEELIIQSPEEKISSLVVESILKFSQEAIREEEIYLMRQLGES